MLAAVALGAALWFAPLQETAPTLAERVETARASSFRDEAEWRPALRALAALGTEEALAALITLSEELRREEPRAGCIRVAAHFVGTGAGRDALRWLERLATGEDLERARPAVLALVDAGAGAGDTLERVVERSSFPEVRARAIGALFGRAARSPGRRWLERIVTHTELGRGATREELRRVLSRFVLADHRRTVEAQLKTGASSPFVQAVLVETALAQAGDGAPVGLRAALRNAHPAVVHAALRGLVERPGVDPAPLRGEWVRLERTRDPSVRRLLAVVRGRLALAEGETDALRRLVASDLRTDRQAAVLLASERRALEPLHRLLADPDRVVAAEALSALESLRDPASLPVLIEALPRASGQVRLDLRETLASLTGEDLGARYEPWRAWWNDRAPSEPLPSEAELTERARERSERDATRAAFYGLPVVSERVAFLLDLSGSMSERVGELPEGEPGSPGPPWFGRSDPRPDRLGVAFHELELALERLADGTWVNVVFFNDEVHAWNDRAVELDDATRARLVAFVRRQVARGGTDLYAGLDAALRDPRLDTVYLLSDGQPSRGATRDPQTLACELSRWNEARRVRLHGVAVGEESELVRALAEATGGQYLLVD